MSRRTQPAVIYIVCDGCKYEAPPEWIETLTSQGWMIGNRDDPDLRDWCPKCVSVRADLVAEIERLRQAIAESLPYIDFASKFERLAETVERVRVLAQNALLANDAGMGYPVVAADDLLHALDGVA